MYVTRCVCRDVAFTHIKAIAKDEGLNLEELAEKTGCGLSCGLCIPYIQELLRTGNTSIPLQPAEQLTTNNM